MLKGILLPENYVHLTLLVKGISLVNTSSISEEDLVLASLLLEKFVADFSSLYGSKNMSHNLHMLLHVERYVRFLGPLWAFSCFKFEDINGRLGNFIHGTRHVGLQIYSKLAIVTQLPLMVHDLNEGEVKNYCHRLLHKRFRLNVQEKISEGLYCIGPLICLNSDFIQAALERVITGSVNVQVYYRLLNDGVLYVSKSYKIGKNDSSYVKYTTTSSPRGRYGKVICFARLTCLCTVPCTCKSEHVAIIKPKLVEIVEINGLEMSHMLSHKCTDSCNDFITFDVYVSRLTSVMFRIEELDNTVLVEPLNEYELQ